jgi:threonine synthase
MEAVPAMKMLLPSYTYQCITCQRQFDSSGSILTCPDCGQVKGTLDVLYYQMEDASSRGKEWWLLPEQIGHWRYRKLLPVPHSFQVPNLPVGSTPLFKVSRLEKLLGCRNIWVKDDTRNPSGSLKDRASSVAVCHASNRKYADIATASTGNAGVSLALWARAAGMQAHVFLPERASESVSTILGIFGARIYRVKGSYDQAFDLCAQAVSKFHWYSRNTATNPVLSEGKKTVAWEIAENMSDHSPDAVIVAVGDGCIFGALWKGFHEAHQLGWIPQVPRLYGIQAAGAAPLAKAFAKGSDDIEPLTPSSIADSIAVGHPRDAMKALRAARQSNGKIIAVPDEAILEAMRELASEVPVFVEPASAAPLAGLKALLEQGDIQRSERVVLVLTGSGSKNIASAKKAVITTPQDIGTSLDSLENIIHQS